MYGDRSFMSEHLSPDTQIEIQSLQASTSEDFYIKPWYFIHKLTANCKEIEIVSIIQNT